MIRIIIHKCNVYHLNDLQRELYKLGLYPTDCATCGAALIPPSVAHVAELYVTAGFISRV